MGVDKDHGVISSTKVQGLGFRVSEWYDITFSLQKLQRQCRSPR